MPALSPSMATTALGATSREAPLAILALRTVQPEEIALVAGLHSLLKQEDQVALVKHVEPRVPRDLLQFAIVIGKVEAQDAGAFGVAAGRRCRRGVAFLRPLTNDIRVARGERLSRMILVLVDRVDPLGVLRAA